MRKLDLFDAARLTPTQVDTQLFRRTEDVLVTVPHLDGHTVTGQHLHVQTERLHLLDEHLEGLRDARLGDVLALDDGLVDLDTTHDVVGLDGEELLERVSSAVGLQGPDLHLIEALATELRLTTQRLLGDHRVRPGGAGVDLVVHQVVKLEHVLVADRDRLGEGLTGTAVEQHGLAVLVDEAVAVLVRVDRPDEAAELVAAESVEDRGRHTGVGLDLGDPHLVQGLLPVLVEPLDGPPVLGQPPQMDLEHLADVHSAGYTQRVEDDVDRGAVLQEGHVLLREDLGDDALVAVAAGDLVTVGDLALLGHVDADHLVHAGRELVAVLTAEHAHTDDLAGLTVRHLQGGVADLTGLLTEDGTQQALLRGQLGLALGRDLADQDVAVDDLDADTDDAPVVEAGQDLIADVGDLPGDLFRTQLGVPCVDLVLLDVDLVHEVVL